MTATNYGFDGLMAIAAFRYCLGRRTYIVGACVDWLIDQWHAFPPNVRSVIARDLREAFERDDAARQHGDRHPLGWDCDRRDWQRAMEHIAAQEAANAYMSRARDSA